MNAKFAVTHPGKLGDLIYSLPTVRDLSKHLNQKIDIIISSLCISARSLLQFQPYINKVIIDFDYKPIHEHRGYQPYNLDISKEEKNNYEAVYHLGYREKDEYPIEIEPLRNYGYYILDRDYNIKINQTEGPSIFLPKSEPLDPFILYQGLGETLDMVLGRDKVDSLLLEWSIFLKSTGKDIVAITGPNEVLRYQKQNINYLVSTDLFQASMIINSSSLVISTQSVVAALANEIDVSRVILSIFPNANPSSTKGMFVPLVSNMDEKNQLRNFINDYFNNYKVINF